MLAEEEARRLVLAEMEEQGEHNLPPLGIHRIEEVSFGWVVHWGAVSGGGAWRDAARACGA
ncbi:hypothetical protein [Streptomyces wuyuanensis]|uniref:hypothetical protein n=1 Tax=Streptomyces wuyuanensis TaxID=1196353 RepID=UPI003712EBF9